MKNLLLPTIGALILNLITTNSGTAQSPPPSAIVGRPLHAALLETSEPSTDLPDAIEEVPDQDALDAANLDPEKTLKSKDWAFVAVFEGPCHFAERLNDVARSLIIYEGMQVVVDQTGKYQVSMIAEAPQTPVVIRLQLHITELVGHERFDHGTITLPPIVIEPGEDLSHQQPSSTIRIRRTGYSHLLHRLISTNKESVADLSFRRSGIARFGSIPEAANYATIDHKKSTDNSGAN